MQSIEPMHADFIAKKDTSPHPGKRTIMSIIFLVVPSGVISQFPRKGYGCSKSINPLYSNGVWIQLSRWDPNCLRNFDPR